MLACIDCLCTWYCHSFYRWRVHGTIHVMCGRLLTRITKFSLETRKILYTFLVEYFTRSAVWITQIDSYFVTSPRNASAECQLVCGYGLLVFGQVNWWDPASGSINFSAPTKIFTLLELDKNNLIVAVSASLHDYRPKLGKFIRKRA